MPCSKDYNNIMARVRRTYPEYGLQRRKKIVNSVIYRKRNR